jgi:hypothetical protein
MEPKPGREVAFTLRCETIPVSLDGMTTFLCLECRKPLDVHQPDADLPDRMLATCDDCKGWHLIDYKPDGRAALVALLPDLDVVIQSAETATKRRGSKRSDA